MDAWMDRLLARWVKVAACMAGQIRERERLETDYVE